MPKDEFLDGCELAHEEKGLTEEEQVYFPLFAESLDPDNPKTIEEQKAEWEELFGETK